MNEPKKKRGKPKGHQAFVAVSIESLLEYFSPKMAIPVSTTFLRQNNIEIQGATLTIQAEQISSNREPTPKIEVEEFSFED